MMNLRTLILASATAALALGSPALAGAATGHAPAPLAFGTFTHPTGVAIDPASGNVYVADGEGVEAIDVFGATGGAPAGGGPTQISGAATPAGAFSFGEEDVGLTVTDPSGPSEPNVFVTDVKHSVLDQFVLGGGTYNYLGQLAGFELPRGVASDADGDIYVADTVHEAIVEYGSDGKEIARFPFEGIGLQSPVEVGRPQTVAVDATGDIFVGARFFGDVVELKRSSPTSSVVQEYRSILPELLGRTPRPTVAMDRATGRLFVDLGAQIDEFEVDGTGGATLVSNFGAGTLVTSEGIAVNETTNEVYATDAGSDNVQAFKPVTLPDASTGPAPSVGKATATVEGTVDPDGAATGFFFEYGPTDEYGQSSSEAEAGSGTATVTHSADLVGLQAETTYHYRIVAKSAEGLSYGPDKTFTTAQAVTLSTGQATNISASGATLNATLNAEGIPTKYHFQYFRSGTELELSTPELETTGAADEAVDAEIAEGELLPNKVYQFRLVGESENGVTYGEMQAFTTKVAAPLIEVPPSAEASATGATFHAGIVPGDGSTSYHFEYGDTSAYGQVLPTIGIGGGTAPNSAASEPAITVEQATGRLTPETTYHYRLVTTNAGGEAVSQDGTFTTGTSTHPPSVAPGAQTDAATGVSSTSAVLTGSIEPNGLPTTYRFEFGPDTNYGTVIAAPESTTEPGAVVTTLEGLAPGTVYHFRVVARNAAGEAAGADGSFTTPAIALALQQPFTPQTIPFALPSETGTPPVVHAPTKAQKLAAAIKKCERDRSRSKRAKCLKAARKKYGVANKSKK
jgi:Fibronectin type III domain